MIVMRSSTGVVGSVGVRTPPTLSSGTADSTPDVQAVFSVDLYIGSGSSKTITNDVNLSGSNGLVWIWNRAGTESPILYSKGVGRVKADSSSAAGESSSLGVQFNTNGFTVRNAAAGNTSGQQYVAWTFKRSAGFFDVVTGTGGQSVSHILGSVPGCVMLKPLDGTKWFIWHNSINPASGIGYGYTAFNDLGGDTSNTQTLIATSTQITTNISSLNGKPFVAYLFADDTSSQGKIRCGRTNSQILNDLGYSSGGAGDYQPQFVLIKKINTTTSWRAYDNIRGMALTNCESGLVYQSAEKVTETNVGFRHDANADGAGDYMYIAVRRGRTYALGSQYYSSTTWYGDGTTPRIIENNMQTDTVIGQISSASGRAHFTTRSLGTGHHRLAPADVAQSANTTAFPSAYSGYGNALSLNTGFAVGTALNASGGYFYTGWAFRRHFNFHDSFTYVGDGTSSRAIIHNLASEPGIVIVKSRTDATYDGTYVFSSGLSAGEYLNITTTAAKATNTAFFPNVPTASTITVGTNLNGNGIFYDVLLFGTSPYSKIGTYTGTGTTSQNIIVSNSSPVVFALIKRISLTSDWFVYDNFTTGNDKALRWNNATISSTADHIDQYADGITVKSTMNTSGVVYLYWTIWT